MGQCTLLISPPAFIERTFLSLTFKEHFDSNDTFSLSPLMQSEGLLWISKHTLQNKLGKLVNQPS